MNLNRAEVNSRSLAEPQARLDDNGEGTPTELTIQALNGANLQQTHTFQPPCNPSRAERGDIAQRLIDLASDPVADELAWAKYRP
jgi:hypothetical protein